MMTQILSCKTVTLATVCAASLSTAVWAQDPDLVNLNDLTCRTYLMLGGEERDLTTLFIHGYFAGKAGQSELRVSDLAAASEKVVSDCIDNPDHNAMKIFGAAHE